MKNYTKDNAINFILFNKIPNKINVVIKTIIIGLIRALMKSNFEFNKSRLCI